MNRRPTGGRRSARDAGETLIELVLVIALLTGSGSVFVSGLFGAVLSARMHDNKTRTHAVASNVAEQVNAAPFVPCAGPADYAAGLPAGVGVAVENWNGVNGWGSVTAHVPGGVVTTSPDDPIPLDSATGFPDTGQPYQVRVAAPDGSNPEIMTVTEVTSAPALKVIRHNPVSHAAPRDPVVTVCSRLQRVTVTAVRDDNGDARVGGQDELAVVSKRGPVAALRMTAAITPGTLNGTVPVLSWTADFTGVEGQDGTLAPTSTVTIQAFHSGDCTGAALAPVTVNIDPDQVHYANPDIDTRDLAAAGAYSYRATYMGDQVNPAIVEQACASPVDLGKATGSILAQPASAEVGQALVDRVSVINPLGGGTLTFALYDDATCTAAPVLSSTVPVPSGIETYVDSTSPVPTHTGTYHWISSFDGDGNNNPIAANACGSTGQDVTVTRATTGALAGMALTAGSVSTDAVQGQELQARAQLSGLKSPTGMGPGTATYTLWDNSSCTGTPVYGPAASSPVTADGDWSSPTPGPTPGPGVYHWQITYDGDDNNIPIAATACTDPGLQVTVRLPVTLDATAAPGGAPSLAAGVDLSATATITGTTSAPSGNVRFRLYEPADTACTGTLVYDSGAVAATAGSPSTAASGAAPHLDGTSPTGTGSYRWTIDYLGDSTYAPASIFCGSTAGTTQQVDP